MSFMSGDLVWRGAKPFVGGSILTLVLLTVPCPASPGRQYGFAYPRGLKTVLHKVVQACCSLFTFYKKTGRTNIGLMSLGAGITKFALYDTPLLGLESRHAKLLCAGCAGCAWTCLATVNDAVSPPLNAC